MTSWNYRVYINESGNYEIQEVYYDSLGRPEYRTEKCSAPYGETLTDLRNDLQQMLQALEKPSLSASDFERTGKFSK